MGDNSTAAGCNSRQKRVLMEVRSDVCVAYSLLTSAITGECDAING